MDIIAIEHSKFMNINNKEERLKYWSETLAAVPYEVAEKAAKMLMIERPYEPKLYDIVQKIKGMCQAIDAPAQNDWPVTDWEIRSMIRLRTSLGMPIPPEYARLAKQRGIPVPAAAITGAQARGD